MSVRLEVSHTISAPAARIWAELTDWVGQERWVPFTTVQVTTEQEQGLGVKATALSGFWLGRLPIGLLDRFVVTVWNPPGDIEGGIRTPAELEVLHLGPYFTGVGIFRLQPLSPEVTTVTAIEIFDLPLGGVTEPLASLARPIMAKGFQLSLKRLDTVSTR